MHMLLISIVVSCSVENGDIVILMHACIYIVYMYIVLRHHRCFAKVRLSIINFVAVIKQIQTNQCNHNSSSRLLSVSKPHIYLSTQNSLLTNKGYSRSRFRDN